MRWLVLFGVVCGAIALVNADRAERKNKRHLQSKLQEEHLLGGDEDTTWYHHEHSRHSKHKLAQAAEAKNRKKAHHTAVSHGEAKYNENGKPHARHTAQWHRADLHLQRLDHDEKPRARHQNPLKEHHLSKLARYEQQSSEETPYQEHRHSRMSAGRQSRNTQHHLHREKKVGPRTEGNQAAKEAMKAAKQHRYKKQEHKKKYGPNFKKAFRNPKEDKPHYLW